MKDKHFDIDIVDIAYQIIAMHKENEYLKQEVEHYKKLNEISSKQMSDITKHHKDTVGIVLDAILDPDSAINEGLDAEAKDFLMNNLQIGG